MTPRVVLIGLPGAGKTTTGRRLAKVLDVEFADSDELVEQRTGRSVTELFAAGEASFRAVEAAAVAAALRDFGGVLALGGGALTSVEVRDALAACSAPVVALRAETATLADRVGDGSSRPLLAAGPVERLQVLAAERLPVYEQLATFAVDTDDLSPGQAASRIAAVLHERGLDHG
jgi:shikimate kinase